LALLPPSFLSSSPATVRSARTGAVKEASAGGGAARRRSRGHGPARLDCTRRGLQSRTRWWSQERRLDMATAFPLRWPHGKRSAQARIWKPGRRRQPSGARERWQPVRGETPQAARCATRTTARPAISQVAEDAHRHTQKFTISEYLLTFDANLCCNGIG